MLNASWIGIKLNRIPTLLATVAVSLVSGIQVSGQVPVNWAHASPEPEEVALPDGSRIQLAFRGDGEVNWYQDPDGFTVVSSGDKYLYAQIDPGSGELVPTKHAVGTVNPRDIGLQPNRIPTTHQHSHRSPPNADEEPFQPVGKLQVMVILMRFSDHKDRKLPQPQDFNAILNAPGGHKTLAPSGSLRDFVTRNSYGKLELIFQIVPTWIDLPETEQYYSGGTSGSGRHARLHEAFRFCLEHIQKEMDVDFGPFDSNKDGYVDGVTFISSGYSGATGRRDPSGAGPRDRIWPHKSWMPRWTPIKGPSVSYYTVNPAFHGISPNPVRIGLLAHEAAHLARLPDLYDSSQRGSGVGAWSCLGYHWGFERSGHYPQHLDPWSKMKLGWVKVRDVAKSGEYELKNMEENPDVIKISAGFPDGEYLLIENRQPVGFHQHLPGGSAEPGGLAIWHIDENVATNFRAGHPRQEGWPFNGNHYKVALLQADGRYDLEQRVGYSGDADDLFRAGHVDQLLPWHESNRYPNTDPYQHRPMQGVRITNISKSQSVMTFRVDIPEMTRSEAPPNVASKTDYGPSPGPTLRAPGATDAGQARSQQTESPVAPLRSNSETESPPADRVTNSSAGVQLLSATLPADKTFTVNRNMVVLKARLTLARTCNVHLSAHGTAICSGKVQTGFSNSGDSTVWPESQRWNTSDSPRRSQLKSVTMVRLLLAGTHELRWKVLVADGAKVEFDNGATFTVQAIPTISTK